MKLTLKLLLLLFVFLPTFIVTACNSGIESNTGEENTEGLADDTTTSPKSPAIETQTGN